MRTRNQVMWVALAACIAVLFSAVHAIAGQKTGALHGRERSSYASKAVPDQLNYQGFLVDAADSSAVTAILEMTFRLFDSASNGTELWSETHSAVQVMGGLFQVLLGSVTPFAAGLFDGTQLWLQTEVGVEVLAPRKPCVSVAYSHRANSAEMILDYTLTDLDDRWVNEDQPSSVSSSMITDDQITDDDISATAAIDPAKISDGPGSGLDADLLDGMEGAAFAAAAHQHDDRYYTEDELSLSGTINDPSNPVDWTKLKGVPAGFADGTDDVGGAGGITQILEGDGIDVTNPTGPTATVAAEFGTGSTQVARGNHDHDADYVNEGQASSITSAMITNGEIVNADISVGAAIDPAKISGTAWTSANDGPGSGLDADLLDGQQASAFLTTASDYGRSGVAANLYEGTTALSDKYVNQNDLDHLDAADGTPANAVYVDAAGNAGVGTISPSTKLDVNGVVTATGGNSNNWNSAYGWGNHAAVGYFELEATNNSTLNTYWNSTASINLLNLDSNTPFAAIYCANDYDGSTWGISAGLTSSSASGYGLYGFHYGAGYGAYGKAYHTDGTGVRGQSSGSTRFGELGTPDYGAYGQYNDNYGFLGGILYGVYGQRGSTDQRGILGHNDYDANYFYHYQIAADGDGQSSAYVFRSRDRRNDGTGYSSSTANFALRGYNLWGDSYSFATAGHNYNDYGRSGGVLGSNNAGSYWGSLGYKNSASSTYGGYFTSYTSGTGKADGAAVGVGMGSWGDLFGADIHGKVYGTYTEGENYALYSNGAVFKNDLDVHLQNTEAASMAVLYANVSTDVTVQTSGFSTMSKGTCRIDFDEAFKKVVSSEVPIVVTVTPTGDCNGVHVAEVTGDGFTVVENNAGKSSVQIAFIAIGRRAGYEHPRLPAEVVSPDYVEKLSRGLHNDGDTQTDGEGLYFENGQLYVGVHPSTLPDLSKPREEERPEEEDLRRPRAIPQEEIANNGQAPDRTRRAMENR